MQQQMEYIYTIYRLGSIRQAAEQLCISQPALSISLKRAEKELGEQIAKGKIEVSIKTGEGGKVFGSVSSKEIAQAAEEQLGLKIDKKKIQLKEQIKSLGVHNVKIKLHPKVTADLKVKVTEK